MLRRLFAVRLQAVRPGTAASLLFHDAGAHPFHDAHIDLAADAALPPHLQPVNQHLQASDAAAVASPSPFSSPSSDAPHVDNIALAGYTGAVFPPHATAVLAAAAREQGLRSPYWITSRVVRNKAIALRPGAKPVSVCLEGNGTPRMLSLRFVDDLDPDDLALFLRDAPPVPPQAFTAGQRSMMAGTNPGAAARRNQYRRGGSGGGYSEQQQQQAHPAAASYTPHVYCLVNDRWRVPGNSDTVQLLCAMIARRRGGGGGFAASAGQQQQQPQDLPPPVFISDAYCQSGNNRNGSGIRVVRGEALVVEDSTRTVFYNAEHTLTPPHTFVPLVPPGQNLHHQLIHSMPHGGGGARHAQNAEEDHDADLE